MHAYGSCRLQSVQTLCECSAGGWQLGHDTVPAARLSRLRGAAPASYALASSAVLPRRLQQHGSGLLGGFGATTATPETSATNPARSPGAGGSSTSSGGASAAASAAAAAAASAAQAAQMASSGDCSGAAGAAAAAADSAQSAMSAAPGVTPLRSDCPTHSMCGL